MHNSVAQVRDVFARKFLAGTFVSTNREASMNALVGSRTIEIVGATFIADVPALFGKPNALYIASEEAWYNSMSLNVNDIPGGPPAIWTTVADPQGFINSNYGWTCFSEENGNQYLNSFHELVKNPESRRAIMIYTRPNMWTDYNKNGRSDFMCTNTVQVLIRDGALHLVVSMRSNDAIFGFKNDYAWQKHIQEKMIKDFADIGIHYAAGHLYWNVGSLHIYERHFFIVHNYAITGEIHITKKDYEFAYPHGWINNVDGQ